MPNLRLSAQSGYGAGNLAPAYFEALYEEWGYPTFESYCLAELRIKKQTADKLVRNFSFLDKHEPERVKAADFAEAAPAWQ